MSVRVEISLSSTVVGVAKDAETLVLVLLIMVVCVVESKIRTAVSHVTLIKVLL